MEKETSNKRKRSCHDQHLVYAHQDHDHHGLEEEDGEEEKIGKFYTLIKGIHESRNRLIKGPDHDRKLDQHKELINKEVGVWKPSFQREDFLESDPNPDDDGDDQVVMIKSPLEKVLCSNSHKEDETTKEGLELDLTLSL